MELHEMHPEAGQPALQRFQITLWRCVYSSDSQCLPRPTYLWNAAPIHALRDVSQLPCIHGNSPSDPVAAVPAL